MSTRQRSRPAVASAGHIEWPNMVSAILLLAVMVSLTGFLLLVRTPLLLPSMSVIALAISAIAALAAWCSSRRRYYLVGYLGRVCVHRVCGRDAQRSSTSAGVLIRVSGASSIIVSDQLTQQTPDHATPSEARIAGTLHFASNKVRALAGAWYRVSWPRLSHNSSHGHHRSPETQPKSLNSNTSSGITNATMTTST